MRAVLGLIARWFAQAFVRRIAVVLAIAALSFIVIGRAQAATITEAYATAKAEVDRLNRLYDYPGGTAGCPYRHYSMRHNEAAKNFELQNQYAKMCNNVPLPSPNGPYYGAKYAYTGSCPTGQQFRLTESVGQCDVPCSSEAEQTGWLYDDTHQNACHEGCSYYGAINLDGSVSFTPDGNTCNVGPENPAPVGDTDGDGVADTDDAFPNDPGESSDTDGDGVGDNGDPAPNDPTDGGDTGAGNESDNDASGGGNCQTPTVCVGDGILCNTLYQSWKIRCAVEAADGKLSAIKEGIDALVEQGEDDGMPTNDMTETNNLLTDLKGLAQELSDMLRGVDDTGVPDLTTGPQAPEEPLEQQTWTGNPITGAGSCPAMAPFEVSLGGETASVTLPLDALCETLAYLESLILAIATIVSVYVILGAWRGN